MLVRQSNTAVLNMRFIAMLLVALATGIGCSTAPRSEGGKENLHEDALAALDTMQREDPSLKEFLDKAHAYAIFPGVGKGGFIAGGAYGRGEVYEGGTMIGFADVSQATIGAQAGGQEFSELIVFESKPALERFMSNKLRFAANASAVALKSGAAKSARYEDGVAIFTRPLGGLMFEASVGGQSFSYRPKE